MDLSFFIELTLNGVDSTAARRDTSSPCLLDGDDGGGDGGGEDGEHPFCHERMSLLRVWLGVMSKFWMLCIVAGHVVFM